MRPRRLGAYAALTVALALVALPGLAGAKPPSQAPVLEAAAFQTVIAPADTAPGLRAGGLDPAHRSAGFVSAESAFLEPGTELAAPSARADVSAPKAPVGSVEKPPRYSFSGVATFYDHGTTALRLPRGTRVVICGGGGCIERIVTDYGPVAGTDRVADLFRPDFFEICGCPWYAGETRVTVKVY